MCILNAKCLLIHLLYLETQLGAISTLRTKSILLMKASSPIQSDAKMNEWSPAIHCDTGIFSETQYCMIESYCCLRRIKSLQSIAKEILVGLLSHLGSIHITDIPHGGNDTQKASKLESCCKMHGLSWKIF